MDSAEAARVFAKRQGLSEETIRYATEISLDAERKFGAILSDAPKNEGTLRRGSILVPREETPTLAELGISKKTSARAQKPRPKSAELSTEMEPNYIPSNEGRAGMGRPSLGGDETEPPKDETGTNSEPVIETPTLGGEQYHKDPTGTNSEPVPTLAELGISKKTSARAQKLADLSDETFDAVKAGDLKVTEALRGQRREALSITLKKGGLCKLTASRLRYGRCATLEWLLMLAPASD